MTTSVVYVRGLTGVASRLRALPRELSSKRGGPVRFALFAAAKIIRDEIIKRAPKGVGTPLPGNLKKQIFAYRDRDPQSAGATERYIISVRHPRRRRPTRRQVQIFGAIGQRSPLNIIGGDAFYWRFVEFGTIKQPAQSFMRNGFETSKHLALRKFTVSLDEGVERAAAKLRRMFGGSK